MTPGAHLLSGWILAESVVSTQRERRLITIIGIIPDLDGMGIVVDLIMKNRTEFFAIYHHLLGHNLLFGLVVSALATLLVSTRKLRFFVSAVCVFHLHLFCDLVGSKGPDGYLWPIHYFYPFAPNVELSWSGQWLLNGWQNLLILAVLMGWALYFAIIRRRSFIETISLRLDREIFLAAEKRWPS